MRTIHTIFRFFPFIALAIALALIEVGRYYRRIRDRRQWVFFAPAGVLFAMAILWIAFRGDLHSDQWVRALFPY